MLALGAWLEGTIRERDRFLPVAIVSATAVAGLTLTGAVHDLGLGSPADHLGWIYPAALASGGLGGWLLWKARMRWFPPVQGVRVNPPGQTGARGRIVSSSVTGEPGSGRAQWKGRDGVLTLVRCHTAGDELFFGDEVRLEEFDDDARSYRVVAR